MRTHNSARLTSRFAPTLPGQDRGQVRYVPATNNDGSCQDSCCPTGCGRRLPSPGCEPVEAWLCGIDAWSIVYSLCILLHGSYRAAIHTVDPTKALKLIKEIIQLFDYVTNARGLAPVVIPAAIRYDTWVPEVWKLANMSIISFLPSHLYSLSSTLVCCTGILFTFICFGIFCRRATLP